MFIIENNIATFSNGCLERTFQLTDSGLQSISMRNLQSGTEFLRKPVEEFAFRMNGKDYSSLSASGFHPVDGNIHTSVMYGGFTPWQHTVTDYGELLEITLQTESFTVTVQWQLHTGICGICKRLIFRNTSSRILKLENVVFDDTCLAPGGDFAACDFYHGQDNAPENPFLMARPYGKGTVIVLALEPGFNLIPLIANIQMCRDELFKDLPLPKENNIK